MVRIFFDLTFSRYLAGIDRFDTQYHSIYRFLLDYQKGRGLPQAIVAHIRAGIQEAAKDPYSILIFSGGETRASVGPVNEGTSYFRVADAMDLWNEPLLNEETDGSISRAASTVRARTVAEEFATDSFQ